MTVLQWYGLALGCPLLDRVRVLLDRPVDDRLELVGGGEAEAALLDDRRRAPALGRQRVEHLLGRGAGDRACGDHAHELAEGLGLDAALRRVALANARDELHGDPARERARVERGGAIRAARRERRLEVVPELRPEREQARRLGRKRELALEALGPRGRELGQGGARAIEHLD